MRPSLLGLLLLSTSAIGQPSGPTPQATTTAHVFTPRDVFALEQVSDPQISPDGKRIAYTRRTGDVMVDKDRSAIWLYDLASRSSAPLGDGKGSRPRWSPDGTRIAYVASDANDRPQLFVRWLDGNRTAQITGLPQAPSSIEWSPDGTMLAFTMFVPDEGATIGTPAQKPEGAKWAGALKVETRINYRADGEGDLNPGFNHVFVVSAEGGAPRQLTQGRFDDGGSLSWTADGKALLFSTNRGKDWERQPLNSDVWDVSVADGALRQLTTRFGPDMSPAASPDGRLIAYVGFDDKLLGYQNVQLSVMNRDGSGTHVVSTALDRSVGDPRWAADGKSIYVDYEDKGETKIARFGLDGRMKVVAGGLVGGEADRPYTGGGFTVARSGAVAFPLGDASHPADLGYAAAPGQQLRLTRLNDDLFLGKAMAQVQPMHVASKADSLAIDYWMVTPPGYQAGRRYPTILEIHGGPFAAYGPSWSIDDQLYAAAGYVVLYANPRGSTSYGEQFANRIHHAYPGQDYDDLMSVVDDAIAKGVSDPANLFVTGGSGGGLLTAWIVGKTDRFRAAVSQKPVIDWASEVLITDGFNGMAQYWFGKMPWEDPEQYWRRSPLSLVGNVKTPTMVMVGEEDRRTPPAEAEQYYAALQLRAVPTLLVRVPGASHGGLADRPSQLIAESNAILAWFARYRSDR